MGLSLVFDCDLNLDSTFVIDIAGFRAEQLLAHVVDRPLMLSFQRLHVYQRAIEFLALTTELVESIPRGNADRIDQLLRSSESIVRNIAEGAGRWSQADCAKHYKIARGEAMESAASLDVMRVRGLIETQRYERGLGLVEEIVAMLTTMIKN